MVDCPECGKTMMQMGVTPQERDYEGMRGKYRCYDCMVETVYYEKDAW